MSSRAHRVSVGQLHRLAGRLLHWRCHMMLAGSVQSQQWLGVLIFSFLFMFQGPSFYHRLRSNKRGRRHTQSQTVHTGDACYSPESEHVKQLLSASFLPSVFHTPLYFFFFFFFLFFETGSSCRGPRFYSQCSMAAPTVPQNKNNKVVIAESHNKPWQGYKILYLHK